MTFDEFMLYVQERIGNFGNEKFWQYQYDQLLDKSFSGIKKEMPYLSIRARANYSGSKLI